MGRAFGTLYCSIWVDPPFLALTPTQQRLYAFLISQPELRITGVIGLTEGRWASKAKGLSSEDIREDLRALDDSRFLVVDWETDEVLIRTFIHHAGVYRNPNVMKKIPEAMEQIVSVRIKDAIHSELLRLDLDGLPPVAYRTAVDVIVRVTSVDRTRSEQAEQGELYPIGDGVPEGVPPPLPGRGLARMRVPDSRFQIPESRELPTRVRRPHPLPDDFILTEADKKFAQERGMNARTAQRTLDKLRAWAQSSGAERKDWHAVWRTFVLRWADDHG